MFWANITWKGVVSAWASDKAVNIAVSNDGDLRAYFILWKEITTITSKWNCSRMKFGASIFFIHHGKKSFLVFKNSQSVVSQLRSLVKPRKNGNLEFAKIKKKTNESSEKMTCPNLYKFITKAKLPLLEHVIFRWFLVNFRFVCLFFLFSGIRIKFLNLWIAYDFKFTLQSNLAIPDQILEILSFFFFERSPKFFVIFSA